MGISHKAASVVESSPPFNRAQLQGFGTDERTLELIGRLNLVRREGQSREQELRRADLGEQIVALYDEFRPRLFRYLRSLNLEREQAEEIIQETFMRLTAQFMKEDDIDNVPGWIVRVAHNLAVDTHKDNLRESSAASDITFLVENRVDPTPNPEEAYSRKEQMRQMETALSALSPRHRQCFELRTQGFSYKEIGRTFGISEQRVALIVKQVSVKLAAACA